MMQPHLTFVTVAGVICSSNNVLKWIKLGNKLESYKRTGEYTLAMKLIPSCKCSSTLIQLYKFEGIGVNSLERAQRGLENAT